jgi:putative acetyltransferase
MVWSGDAMADDIELRPEADDDRAQVWRVNELAFGRPDEAAVVEALRGAGPAILSLVAVRGGAVVGHILFSPVTIASPAGELAAVGLAPMAVAPEAQRTGVGSRLVRAGLEALRRAGHDVVVVLGHPAYYPRFGFERASRHGLSWEHPCADEAFMVLALRPGALAGRAGIVRYRPELSGV